MTSEGSAPSATAMAGVRQRAVIFLLNAALAIALQAVTSPVPELSDRVRYEWAGTHPLGPSCPSISGVLYCYRVLVPVVLEQVPADPDLRWRVYRWTATAVAGTVVALTAASPSGSLHAAIAASILTQASYGFAFTAYDPYSADPAVFLTLALLAWCWLRDRWGIALALALVGIFAKETVALMSVATALAALIRPRRASWKIWVAEGALVIGVLALYRWIMQAYLGWAVSSSASLLQIELVEGGWLRLWMQGNPPATQAFLIFASFAFAWVYAALGVKDAGPALRNLALGSALPFLALNYVQNPERALGNLFFVVIPLASLTLARVPAGLAVFAAVASAAITARAGTSSPWLPPALYLLVPGFVAAILVARHRFAGVRFS